MFDSQSRYAAIETATFTLNDGTDIAYKRRRFLPVPVESARIGEVTVTQGDRIDLLAAKTLGDPRLYWRLADLELTFDPFQLAAPPGRRIGIPAPWAAT